MSSIWMVCQVMWLYHLNSGHPYCLVLDEFRIQVFSIQMVTVLHITGEKTQPQGAPVRDSVPPQPGLIQRTYIRTPGTRRTPGFAPTPYSSSPTPSARECRYDSFQWWFSRLFQGIHEYKCTWTPVPYPACRDCQICHHSSIQVIHIENKFTLHTHYTSARRRYSPQAE